MTAKAAHGFIEEIELPDLASDWPGSIRVKSFDQVWGGAAPPEETVNLGDYTCTCHEFVNHRARFPRLDPRRACVHIVRGLILHRNPDALDDFLFGIFNSDHCRREGFWVDSEHLKTHFVTLGDHHRILMVRDSTEWIDIIAQTATPFQSRPYKRFAYNLKTGRWLYNLPPRDAAEILTAIRQQFALGKNLRLKTRLARGIGIALAGVVLASLLILTALVLLKGPLAGH